MRKKIMSMILAVVLSVCGMIVMPADQVFAVSDIEMSLYSGPKDAAGKLTEHIKRNKTGEDDEVYVLASGKSEYYLMKQTGEIMFRYTLGSANTRCSIFFNPSKEAFIDFAAVYAGSRIYTSSGLDIADIVMIPNLTWVEYPDNKSISADNSQGCNAILALALTDWNNYLKEKVGTDLREFGFSSFVGGVIPAEEIPSDVSILTENGVTYQVTSASEVEVTAISDQMKVTIPETITIGARTYKVTAISDRAAEKRSGITSLTIKAPVKSIGKRAFAGCRNLKKISINASALETVGKNAFKNIKANSKIHVTGGKADKAFSLIRGATNRTLRLK